tara:strand:+ start:196 stop:825 length:630 start_codon:yes stop_codon:yes gene_type:complete
MFSQQTRLNRERGVHSGVIESGPALRYFETPIPSVHPGDVFFNNNTLPSARSIGILANEVDSYSSLTMPPLTHCKDPQLLPTDRLSLTTPLIRFSNQNNYDKLIPKESEKICAVKDGETQDSHCNNSCDRGLSYKEEALYYDPQSIVTKVQNGFSNSLNTSWGPSDTNGLGLKPQDSRLVLHDMYAKKEQEENANNKKVQFGPPGPLFD